MPDGRSTDSAGNLTDEAMLEMEGDDSTVATKADPKRVAVVKACTELGYTICGACNEQTAQLEAGGWVPTFCDCAMAEIERLRAVSCPCGFDVERRDQGLAEEAALKHLQFQSEI